MSMTTDGRSTDSGGAGEPPPASPVRTEMGAAIAGGGAALTATIAGACCVPILSPLLVSVLGVSGAVTAARLGRYSAAILALAGASLAYGFWTVYRRRQAVADAGACRRGPSRLVRSVLWSSAAVWLLALVVNVVRPF